MPLIDSLIAISTCAVAVALVCFGAALAGARRGIELRCRKCGHEVARTGEPPAKCGECGAELASPNALVVGRWRVRGRLLALAIGLLAAAIALPFANRLIAQTVATLGVGGDIGSVIDKAAAGDLQASMELSRMLGAPASKATDDAWRDATARFARDPAARAAILNAVVEIDGQMGMGMGAAPTGFNASDAALRTFGVALASALEADRALAANLPRSTAFSDALPFDLAEPVLASEGAKRAFLRGPKLRLSPEGSRGAGGGMQRVRLVRDGFAIFGRELAFGEATTLYRRKDGSEHALRAPFGAPELDATFGTMIDLGAARRDPEWNGEVVVRATVGTTASVRRGAGRRGAQVDDPFQFIWTIVVDSKAPVAGKRLALNGTTLTAWMADQLRGTDIGTEGAGDDAALVLELAQLGTINGVHAGVRAEVLQAGRSWSEPDDFDAHGGQAARPMVRAAGFDATKPFEVKLRGVAPGDSRSGDCAYIAGTWTLEFDRAGRPPRTVSYTPVVDAQPLDRAPDDLKPDRGGGEEIE